ncbi:hypothetical protein OG799_09615 [Micromonospora sp. NBC_00898]|nr:hypothetical protein OG799_09615 [Micromonospora sp. NBC_00898]
MGNRPGRLPALSWPLTQTTGAADPVVAEPIRKRERRDRFVRKP